MKILYSLITMLLLAISVNISFAQNVNEVTLTVSSDGPTKDEAVKNALRSAIEQSYGAFVSANTTILNDELVKDEIVTVSNGSIKEYKELACAPTQNGGQFVTLQATVSLPQLIKYAQSKGSECEFAGNTFAMNTKLRNINKENTIKVLKDIEGIFKNTNNLYDYKLSLGEPYESGDNCIIKGTVGVYPNPTYLNLVNLYVNTIEGLGDEFIYKAKEQIDYLHTRLYLAERIVPDEYQHRRSQLDKSQSYYKIGNPNNPLSYVFEGDCIFDISKIIYDKKRNFFISDNHNSPTKNPIKFDRRYRSDSDCFSLSATDVRNPYLYYGFGSTSKPYNESKHLKNLKEVLNSLEKRRNELERGKNVSHSDSLLYTAKIVKYNDEHSSLGETWAIKLLWFDPEKPLTEFGFEISVPMSEIGKYSNFRVEPANK